MRDKNWLGRREAGRKAAAGEETVRGRKYGRLTHLPTAMAGLNATQLDESAATPAGYRAMAMAARLPL